LSTQASRLAGSPDVGERRTFEGQVPGQALVGDHPQREEIAASVDLDPLRLLRAHVDRAAQDLTVRRASHRRAELGDTEVKDLEEELVALVARQEQVLGLNVAVHDARGMRPREPARRVLHHAQHNRRRQPPVPLEGPAEIFALEVLHRDVGATVFDAVVEDADDVRALDLRGRARLVREPR
jgi:hypothetical protein